MSYTVKAPIAEILDIIVGTFRFSGRSSRFGGLFYLFLINPILQKALNGIPAIEQAGFRSIGNADLTGLIAFLPLVAWMVRRLHDLGKTGWWAIALLPVSLIPKGTFPDWIEFLIVLPVIIGLFAVSFIPGASGPNRYGPDPLCSDEDLENEKAELAEGR